MAEKRGKEPLPQVQWKEEKRVLTLEKIPVLELELSVPQLTGGGRGGERISRYYQRLAGAWRSRWGRETYWNACLDLARCREVSRPFRPWAARLSGEVLFQDEGTLSIRMDGAGGRPVPPGAHRGPVEAARGGPSAGAELFSGGPAVVAPPDPQAPGAGGGQAGGGGLLSGPGFRRAAPALAVPLPVLPHPGGAGILHPTVCFGPVGGGSSHLFASPVARAAVKTAAGREPGGQFYHPLADSWLISSSRRDSP